MEIALTPQDMINLKVKLWNADKFNFFLPKHKDTGEVLPFPKQELAWKTIKDNKIKEFVYGGAAGGAKTHTFATAFLLEHLAIPGLRSAVCRKNLNDLTETTLISFYDAMDIYGISQDEVHYHEKKNQLRFKNGSRIDFLAVKYEPSDPKYRWLGSRMYSYVWFEEAQEIPYYAYVVMSTRVGRQFRLYEKIGRVIDKLIITMNPDKNWVYKFFYLPFVNNSLEVQRAFIPALAKENPTTPKEYLERLDRIPDEQERAKLRDGVWEYEDMKTALFKYAVINKMFDDEPAEKFSGRYITCDPARKGKDNAIIFVWEGFRVIEIHISKKCRTTDIEDRIQQIQRVFNIPNENVIIDSNGVGGGINDHIDGSFEFIGHSKPIVDFSNNMRANSEYPSPYDSLRDQVLWVASDFVLKGMVTFAKDLRIERFGDYTDLYTHNEIKESMREELEKIYKTTEDSDKKIKLTKKHEIAQAIGRSTDFSDCWSMRFVTHVDPKSNEKEFGMAVIPYAEDFDMAEENKLYDLLTA
jgi:phage terminase large subunit